jgi:hypothetical protein
VSEEKIERFLFSLPEEVSATSRSRKTVDEIIKKYDDKKRVRQIK